jgi:hypothetical protein
MTPEQEFTLAHLGIERWVTRSWPLQASAAPVPLLWIQHDAGLLEGKPLRLLQNIVRCMALSPDQVGLLSAVEQPLHSRSLLYRVSLQRLLTHPSEKKQVYQDLLQVKQRLLACGHLV